MCKIYIVNYHSIVGDGNYHQALFVETDSPARPEKGVVFEVEGPNKREGKDEIRVFDFKPKMRVAPRQSGRFVSIKEIGRLTDSLEGVYDVCHLVRPPVVPKTFHGECPNARDWVNNVIYEMNKQGMVEFNSNYSPPPRAVGLVSKELSVFEAGSSWKSTDKGSSSKSTEKSSSRNGSKH